MSANFPALVPIEITVPSGQLVSTPLQLTGLALRKTGALAVVQVDCPAGITSSTAEVQFNTTSTAGNFVSRYDEYGTLISFPAAASRSVVLPPPKYCTVFPYIRIKLSASTASDKVYTVWLRSV